MRAPPFPREIIPQPAGFQCRAAPSTRPCNPAASLAETRAGLSPAVDNELTQPRQRRRPAPPANAAAAGSLPPSFHHHQPTPSLLAQQRGEQTRGAHSPAGEGARPSQRWEGAGLLPPPPPAPHALGRGFVQHGEICSPRLHLSLVF